MSKGAKIKPQKEGRYIKPLSGEHNPSLKKVYTGRIVITAARHNADQKLKRALASFWTYDTVTQLRQAWEEYCEATGTKPGGFK